jgi:phosphate transport system substrate-binding protein
VKGVWNDFVFSITDAPGRTAYPIASFTWLLVPLEWRDANKKMAFVHFIGWMVNDGRAIAMELGYVPLSPEVIVMVKGTIRRDSSRKTPANQVS